MAGAGRSLTRKLVEQRLLAGKPVVGEEIGLGVDQVLLTDTNGTMAFLQFEAMGFPRVVPGRVVTYIDHNVYQFDSRNSDDHRYLQTTSRRYGAVFSKPGNGICHQVHVETFAVPGQTLLGTDSHTPLCGAAGMLGWHDLVSSQAAELRKRGMSCILLWMQGGPSQLETFDPKPDAPTEVRGPFGTVATKLAGIHFSEHLPRLAQRANRFSIVRTMHHPADRQFRNEHSSCMYLLHTGTAEMPIGDTNATINNPRPGRFEWPSIGALLAYTVPPSARKLRH